MVDLNKEIKYVKGVGPNREVLLNKLKIYTLKDLITYYPRDYEDSKTTVTIDQKSRKMMVDAYKELGSSIVDNQKEIK